MLENISVFEHFDTKYSIGKWNIERYENFCSLQLLIYKFLSLFDKEK